MNQKKNRKSMFMKTRVWEEFYDELIPSIRASGLSESAYIRRALSNAVISGNNAQNQKVMEHICNIHTLLNKAKFTIDDVVIDEIQGEVSGLFQCLL